MTENDVVARLNSNGSELSELLGAYLHDTVNIGYFSEKFKKFLDRGTVRFVNTWNWGAFWLGPFYSFHRKLNAHGAATLVASFFLWPFIIAFMPFCAMTVNYFLIKQFCRDLVVADYGNSPFETVKNKISLMGGKEKWPIVVFVIFWSLTLIVFIIACIVLILFIIAEYGYLWGDL